MTMWVLHESYDPATQMLYLDLVSKPAVAPEHPGHTEHKVLGRFKDAADARQFTDGYLKSLAYKMEKVVKEVRCGEHRLGGCNGPGKPCYLGLDSYPCRIREGR
jgi:hypothetical protein